MKNLFPSPEKDKWNRLAFLVEIGAGDRIRVLKTLLHYLILKVPVTFREER